MVRERSNMDGKDPSGSKVVLLDRHHLYAFLCDPHMYEWRSQFQLQASLPVLMREMIDLSVPLDVDKDDTSKSRKRVLANFQEFNTQQGEWLRVFPNALPKSVLAEELEKNNKFFFLY